MQPWEVFKYLRTLSQSKAGITGDLPVRIIREFAYELSVPLTNILNASFQQSEVPCQWKQAEIVPIPKVHPATILDLRPIALTSYFAKLAESFIAKWLLEDITKHLDCNQFGNRRGLSTNHYLIGLIHQILENAERAKSASTILMTDFSKAFDRINHNIIVQKLLSFDVRPCLINWIMSFLDNRLQCVRYNGRRLNWNSIHTGVQQLGTKLRPILFLVLINDACQNSIYNALFQIIM